MKISDNGNYLYLADGAAGLKIIDLRNIAIWNSMSPPTLILLASIKLFDSYSV